MVIRVVEVTRTAGVLRVDEVIGVLGRLRYRVGHKLYQVRQICFFKLSTLLWRDHTR